MLEIPLSAAFEEISLESAPSIPGCAVVVPTVRATRWSKFGRHAYYFLNFQEKKGLCVTIGHMSLILPGIARFRQAAYKKRWFAPITGFMTLRYHYGFNFLEQIMLMTVPHCVTDLGQGQFMLSLWSYFGSVVIDCANRRVTYRMLEPSGESYVLGSRQWYERSSNSLIYMCYSLKDSLRKALDPRASVNSKILRLSLDSGTTTEIWSGEFSDYMHDLLVSKDGRFLVVCELGRFSDDRGDLIPSKVMVIDQTSGRQWTMASIPNAAHAQFDPEDPAIIYLSNHNFRFLHTPLYRIFGKGTYNLEFLGPASIHKYALTPDGPVERARYAPPDLFRLTNHHIFMWQGRKVIAAMGAPNFIFIIDAESMELIKKLEVQNPDPHIPAYIGTFVPDNTGEKLFVQTTRSFQILDIQGGAAEFMHGYDANHTCSNHMAACANVTW
ncbi:MAG: hypothetical protein IT291_04780 [Deltaproteobacteria bacterium]|nr:hypothetical protein [Deltaproteobacteria bacterium]